MCKHCHYLKQEILPPQEFGGVLFILKQAPCKVVLEFVIFFVMAAGQVEFTFDYRFHQDRELRINNCIIYHTRLIIVQCTIINCKTCQIELLILDCTIINCNIHSY